MVRVACSGSVVVVRVGVACSGSALWWLEFRVKSHKPGASVVNACGHALECIHTRNYIGTLTRTHA